jgi:putative transposase
VHWLNVTYRVWFNRRRNRVGTLLQGRFKALLHEPENCALIISRYIHLNPVRLRRFGTHRRGLSLKEAGGEDAAGRDRLLEQLRNYQWSSYGSYARKEKKYQWLTTETILASFGNPEMKQNQRRYVRGIEELIGADQFETEWKTEVVGQLFFGPLRFVQDMKKRLNGMNRNEQKAAKPWESFHDRHGDSGRDLAMLLASERAGMRLSQIGQMAGGLKYPAVAADIRLVMTRLQQDESLARKYRRICRYLYFSDSEISK